MIKQLEWWAQEILRPLGRVVAAFVVFLMAAFPVAGVFLIGLGISRTIRPVAGDSAIGGLFFGVVLFVIGLVFYRGGTIRDWAAIAGFLPKHDKPIVRVWTHDRVTIVTTEAVYQLAKQLRDWEEIALGKIGRRLVCPRLYALVTDKVTFNRTCTSAFYNALIDGCVVEESEMFVPHYASCEMIGKESIWRLVHGSDSKPPENI